MVNVSQRSAVAATLISGQWNIASADMIDVLISITFISPVIRNATDLKLKRLFLLHGTILYSCLHACIYPRGFLLLNPE